MLDTPLFKMGIFDFLDIVLVALLIYQFYRFVKGTGVINIMLGFMLVFLIWRVVKALNMDLLSNILGAFFSVGVLALIIIFQSEIRQFLLLFGSKRIKSDSKKRNKKSLLNFGMTNDDKLPIDQIVSSCVSMAETKTGALIVITMKNELQNIVNTGDLLNARISNRLIESIFFKNSPLHDGAMIISYNTIKAARCILPVSDNTHISASLGLRHRAAIGVTENSDSIAIVISEERGTISLVENGEIRYNLNGEALTKELDAIFV